MNAVIQQEPLALVEQPAPAALPSVHAQSAVPLADNSPAAIMMTALSRGVTPEQLKQMLDLQMQWEANEARKAFNVDFAGFKSEAVEIIKRKRVHYVSQQKGTTTDYKHAELSDVVEALSPALSKHRFSFRFIPNQSRDWIEVTCELRHALGHCETATLGGPPDNSGNKNAVQAIASTKTMLERQTLKAVCGVAEKGDDDDGRGAAGAPEAERADPDADAIKSGEEAAQRGMKALTDWWGGLSSKQRGRLSKQFGAMRRDAAAVDKGAGRA
jgi:hypothetical protein